MRLYRDCYMGPDHGLFAHHMYEWCGTIASAGTDKRPRQKVQAKEVSWINGLFAHHMYEWCGTIASAGTDKRPR
jgi:hypothetical protein